MVGAGQTIGGTGTLTASVNNVSDIVSPGNSPGTLTINGNYAQSGSDVLNIEFADLTNFDKLVITGNGTLGGTLNISFGSNFPNAFPATLDFLTTGGTVTGSFDQVNLIGTLPSGATDYSFVQSATGNGFKLSIIVVPK